MDKILITYRGGYGDIYSILTYFNELKNCKITMLIEPSHSFLKQLFKDIVFILNPYEKIINQNLLKFNSVFSKHFDYKDDVKNFNQDLYDDSIIECAFYSVSEFSQYRNFYHKLIEQHDLIITNYLDLTAISVLNETKKEWWQIRSWYKWRNDLPCVKLLNQQSPFRNIYYYEKDWIKGYETDENGDYHYRDNDFFHKTVDINKENFKLSLKLNNHEKIFFVNLGSMNNHNLGIGRHIKYKVALECKRLFDEGWVGITTKKEYEYLKNIKEEKFIYLIDEWYPHEIIFKYIKLFLTHGGAGSFSRAMKNKVKTYVFPFQLDQFYFGEIIKNYYEGKMIV
jgi:hypothetical protein